MKRETFLRSIASFSAVPMLLAVAPAPGARPFRVLVFGDSIAWGQGLEASHRWRALVIGRLRAKLGRDVVEVSSELHSGATIGLGDRDQLDETPRDHVSYESYSPKYVDAAASGPTNAPSGSFEHSYLEEDALAGEIPSSTPTVLRQIDDFDDGPDRDTPIDLILLSAGINDVAVTRLLDPLADRRYVAEAIEVHCHRHLVALLDRLRVRFVEPNPACTVVVLSYYPMIGKDSLALPSTGELLKALLDSPGATRTQERARSIERGASILTGDASGTLGGDDARPATLRAAASSQIRQQRRQGAIVRALVAAADRFFRESEAAIDRAVADANRTPFSPAFVHVTPGIDPDRTVFTVARDPQLWSLQSDAFEAEDEVAVRRSAICERLGIDRHDLDASAVKECYVASIGHPNVAGAERYADAIWKALEPRLVER